MNGCSESCPIKEADICCMSARQCCFTCMEDTCPIKDIYAKVLRHYETILSLLEGRVLNEKLR
jgi:DNA-binding IscR family transcriptional regulator